MSPSGEISGISDQKREVRLGAAPTALAVCALMFPGLTAGAKFFRASGASRFAAAQELQKLKSGGEPPGSQGGAPGI